MSPMLAWTEGLMVSNGFDDEMRQLADRHYSRRTIGARQFLYAGRRLVLRDAAGLVLFAWMYPDESMRMDGQRGYNNAIFRNESDRKSSDIILEAERAAFKKWGPNRLYTYIDPKKVRSSNPGYCFKVAGWKFVRLSAGGKHLLSKYDELGETSLEPSAQPEVPAPPVPEGQK
jgi:hypothetical protein